MKNFLKDNLVIIIIVAVFLITVGLFGYIFVKKMTDSQKDIEDKVSFIEKQYQEFSTSSSVISEQRTKIYNEVFNNAYYVDFSSKDEEWKTYFNDYYDLIDELYNNYKEVLTVCKSYNFIYDSTKQKCDSISKYYEILLNNFSIDYKIYNDVITKYNEWVDSNESYAKLELFSKNKYIEQQDYNNNNEIEHY